MNIQLVQGQTLFTGRYNKRGWSLIQNGTVINYFIKLSDAKEFIKNNYNITKFKREVRCNGVRRTKLVYYVGIV